jgi:hypothetical protein
MCVCLTWSLLALTTAARAERAAGRGAAAPALKTRDFIASAMP